MRPLPVKCVVFAQSVSGVLGKQECDEISEGCVWLWQEAGRSLVVGVAWPPALAVSVPQITGHAELLYPNMVNKHPPPIWLLQEVGPAEALALLRNAGTHCGW